MPPGTTPLSQQQVSHRGICWLGFWGATSDALLDCYRLASRTELLAHHGNVVIKIIVHVEGRAVVVRIEHADLDHHLLPVRKKNWDTEPRRNQAADRVARCRHTH